MSRSWFVLAVLTLLSGWFTVRIPTIPARLSVSETFVFATVLMFGPAAANVVVLDTLVISFWLGRRSNPRLGCSSTFRRQPWLFGLPPRLLRSQWNSALLGVSTTDSVLVSFRFLDWLFSFLTWHLAYCVRCCIPEQQSAFVIWRHNLLGFSWTLLAAHLSRHSYSLICRSLNLFFFESLESCFQS